MTHDVPDRDQLLGWVAGITVFGSPRTIEALVTSLQDDLGPLTVYPVPLPGIHGVALKRPKETALLVDDQLQGVLHDLTVCHELGHRILHHGQLETNIAAMLEDGGLDTMREWEAEWVARWLLTHLSHDPHQASALDELKPLWELLRPLDIPPDAWARPTHDAAPLPEMALPSCVGDVLFWMHLLDGRVPTNDLDRLSPNDCARWLTQSLVTPRTTTRPEHHRPWGPTNLDDLITFLVQVSAELTKPITQRLHKPSYTNA